MSDQPRQQQQFQAWREIEGVVHAEAQCMTCGFNGVAWSPPDAAKLRRASRRHVEATGHTIDFEVTINETYEAANR